MFPIEEQIRPAAGGALLFRVQVSGGLTAVALVSPVPAVVHAVTVEYAGQALGQIPAGKISFCAQRSDCTAFSQCKI